MASLRTFWLAALVLSSTLIPLTAGYPRGGRRGHNHHHLNRVNTSFTSPNPAAPLLRHDTDPADFSWISKWAAIGDSYTAGIGSGNRLGLPTSSDWLCSRYSYSWAKILNYAFGPSVEDFQFTACSGARTEQIYNQAIDLNNSPLDLVMMTAGGNDLCLATMITNCIILAWRGEDVCQEILDKAQENIDTILKDNLRDILSTLDAVVKEGGYVVYSGYAPFFDTTNEDCGDLTKQNWAIQEWWWWSYYFKTPLALTVDRRNKFNTLVANVNKAISEVVDEFAADEAIGYNIVFSDWSSWGAEVDGQMCSPSGIGLYPEPTQPELQFIKRNTYVRPERSRELKRQIGGVNAAADEEDEEDEVDEEEMRMAAERAIGGAMTEERCEQFLCELEAKWAKVNIYDSLLPAQARPRAPVPPNCPGDDATDPTLGLGLPDKLAANFHPNERGHENMAAFAMESLVWLRAKALGVDAPICNVPETVEFTCWQQEGSHAFASGDRMNENYKDSCDSVDRDAPTDTLNWRQSKTYHDGTQDAHEMLIVLSNGPSAFNKGECLDSFSRIINGCDGNDPDNNPLDFKFGGSYVRGDYEYQINPKHDRTLVKERSGDCNGNYKGIFGSYTLRGNGWASSDFGADTLLPAAKTCVGGGITQWKFDYCLDSDKDDCGGYEWKATFRTPIFVRARCFNNDKVQKAAGGSTNGQGWGEVGCSGSD